MYNPNTFLWKPGDIVIHSGVEPLHKHKKRYKMLMVVLTVGGTMAKTRYINTEELREDREIEVLRILTEENSSWLLKRYSFEQLQGIYNDMYEKSMRCVYFNDMAKLHRPSEHGIFVGDFDLNAAEDIFLNYQKSSSVDRERCFSDEKL